MNIDINAIGKEAFREWCESHDIPFPAGFLHKKDQDAYWTLIRKSVDDKLYMASTLPTFKERSSAICDAIMLTHALAYIKDVDVNEHITLTTKD